jgi:hypothetical protein
LWSFIGHPPVEDDDERYCCSGTNGAACRGRGRSRTGMKAAAPTTAIRTKVFENAVASSAALDEAPCVDVAASIWF